MRFRRARPITTKTLDRGYSRLQRDLEVISGVVVPLVIVYGDNVTKK